MEKTAYEILGVSPTATDEEIKRQYHTLIRNVHSDNTSLKELTEEERQKCEKLVREYNGAYGNLSKGKRADYDRKLAKARETYSSEQTWYAASSATSADWDVAEMEKRAAAQKVEFEQMQREAVKRAASKIFEEQQLNDLFKRIFESGASFYGSVTPDPNQKLKQDDWKLKLEREKLERDLRIAEQEARTEYMKKSLTNDLQLGYDARQVTSKISSLEAQRTEELRRIERDYFFKLNKRFMTDKKRQKLLQEQKQEEEKINGKYRLLMELYNQKRVNIENDLVAYQKAEKEAIGNNLKVQEIRCKLEQVQSQLDAIGVKLGYQTQTSSYTSSYNVKK